MSGARRCRRAPSSKRAAGSPRCWCWRAVGRPTAIAGSRSASTWPRTTGAASTTRSCPIPSASPSSPTLTTRGARRRATMPTSRPAAIKSSEGADEAPSDALREAPEAPGRRLLGKRELRQGDLLGQVLEDDADAPADRHVLLGFRGEVGAHQVGDDAESLVDGRLAPL